MSFWEANSAMLRARFPGLLDAIHAAYDEGLSPEDLAITAAPGGAPSLSLRGIHVHSPRDPEREGHRLAEAALNAPAGANATEGSIAHNGGISHNSGDSPVIILGFGLGYAACAAAELAPERPIIIVEKYYTLLRKALELRDMGNFLAKHKIVFVAGGSGEGIGSALALFEENSGGRIAPVVMRNKALITLDEAWYKTVESRIRTFTMKDDVNMATLKRFGQRWVRNLARNMNAIRGLPGINGLAGIAAGGSAHNNGLVLPFDSHAAALPVFLAAAGPGLEQCGPALAEIQRRCIVVAVDTSLRFLVTHGVEPDFVLVVDPQFWNSRHLDRCVCGERTRLIAESAVYPPVLRLPFRGVYLCGSLFPLGSFIEQRVDPKGLLGAGGSVATTAWDFARVLGATEIWIAGLDLAFPEFKTHFKGARFEEKALSESGRINPSETWLMRALRDGGPFLAASNTGGQVLTDRRLSLYAAWFENRFRQYPHVRNFSLSAGGLAIAGLENAQAEKILDLPPLREEIDRRLDAAFSKIENDFSAAGAMRQRNERYREARATLLRGLANIKHAADRGAEIAERALKQGGHEEKQKITAALDGITKTIANSEVKEVAGFLFPPPKTPETSAVDPFRAWLEASLSLYKSLSEAAYLNLEPLEKSTATLQ
jgi:hypothetical protein